MSTSLKMEIITPASFDSFSFRWLTGKITISTQPQVDMLCVGPIQDGPVDIEISIGIVE